MQLLIYGSVSGAMKGTFVAPSFCDASAGLTVIYTFAAAKRQNR